MRQCVDDDVFVTVSAPQFVVALLLLYVFAVQAWLVPDRWLRHPAHLVLPALTLGILGSGWYARMMRSSMIDVLRADFIRTARAKGLTRARVILRHAMPNAILPIIAMIGIDIGIFMGGIVVVEGVFGWPGIGQLAWQAIQRVDIPIIMGVTLVSACAIVLGNLLADLIAPLIDPRIRIRNHNPNRRKTMKKLLTSTALIAPWRCQPLRRKRWTRTPSPAVVSSSPTRTTSPLWTPPSAMTGRTGR